MGSDYAKYEQNSQPGQGGAYKRIVRKGDEEGWPTDDFWQQYKVAVYRMEECGRPIPYKVENIGASVGGCAIFDPDLWMQQVRAAS